MTRPNTRERILEVALDLFNHDGEAATTTNAIADTLDISPGNLHYHFRTKQSLVDALFERFEQRMLALLSDDAPDRIEIDDAYLGGERPGKRGRGAEHKFPFVAAMKTDEDGHPQRLQLRWVSGFTLSEMRRYAQQAIAPDSQVISDGLGCFRAFDTTSYVHQRHITGGGRASVANPEFNWVNTLLGNVKNVITGTYQVIRRQHAPLYLAKFKYRFNRRYDLRAMIPRFLTIAARTPTMPCRFLKMAERYA